MSTKAFETYFSARRDTEFVSGYDLSTSDNESQRFKIRLYHFFRDVPCPFHSVLLKRILVAGTREVLKAAGFRRSPYVKLSNGETWDVYFGSSWFSLTWGCARYVHETMRRKELIHYFRSVYAPDELLIPTIVHNSPFSAKAVRLTRYDFKAASLLHYLNYTSCIWSYDQSDFDTIIHSGKVFVRKLVSGKSEELIERIDRYNAAEES